MATLVLGLSDNSRTRRHFSKQTLTLEQVLLAVIADNLQFISWSKTKDAQHNKNKPKSIVNKLINKEETKEDLEKFETPEEFETYINTLREEHCNG